MSTENSTPEENKAPVANQHLADRIAGKVDEQGKTIEAVEESEESKHTPDTNETLAKAIAGESDTETPTHIGDIKLESPKPGEEGYVETADEILKEESTSVSNEATDVATANGATESETTTVNETATDSKSESESTENTVKSTDSESEVK
jgi:hypothetical protein